MDKPRHLCAINHERLSQQVPLQQKDLADLIGCDRSNLSQYETGQVLPTLATAFKIAFALGVTVETLWFELAEQAKQTVHEHRRDLGQVRGYEADVQPSVDK